MRSLFTRIIFATAILVTSFEAGTSTTSAQTLTVNAAAVRQAIQPDVYGMFGGTIPLDPALAATLKTPNVRWGGDGATRYNWNYNATCDGNDNWFVCQLIGGGPTPGYLVDSMISTYRTSYSGTHILVTIPIIPWIDSSSTELCSYPVSVYGPQQAKITIGTGQVCGNGKTPSGTNIINTNIAYDMVANSTTLQTNWLNHLISTWGTAANGGVKFYQLDNEPGGWANTHRDAEPTQPDYSVISSLGEQYATAIKTADPTATVLGPSDFGEWGWVTNSPTGTTLLSGQYYLQQFAAYDAAHGSRSLDCFDEHYGVGDSSSPAASFSQVRTYWDPTYATSGDFVYLLTGTSPAPIMMIPRFQNWISTYYPGTSVCMSEYEVQHTGNTLVDALVLTDALGVFGYYNLQLANLYDTVNSTDPEAYSFRMYRNYDGAGSQFGDTSVSSTSTDPTESTLSVYGALRSSDGKLTVMAINKTTTPIVTTLNIAGFTPTSTASTFTYSGANLASIVSGSSPVTSGAVQSYSFPSYSATLFVFTSASGAPPQPPTDLTATVE
jgi:Glycoside hydrolase family 44